MNQNEHPPVVIAGGNTETARIDGISAAGASPDLMAHTPSADFEIVAEGHPVHAPVVPVSPSGCPTPAVMTRAVRDLLSFETIFVDAGLASPTSVSTLDVGANPGADIREEIAVPEAEQIIDSAQNLITTHETLQNSEELLLAETIPGGTTTALGVLTALGERQVVSSSLPTNPVSLKQETVQRGLQASGLEPGDAADDPVSALHTMGDPVLAAVTGLLRGAVEHDIEVILAGGTQMATAAALARHDGITEPLSLATTSFVAGDETAGISALTTDLDVSLCVTDPGFENRAHPALDGYVAGEAKEGVGMGGALFLTDQSDVTMETVREQCISVYDELVETSDSPAHVESSEQSQATHTPDE